MRTRVGDLRRDAPSAAATTWRCSRPSATCSARENRDLLRRVFAALAPGGRLVIQDHVMAEDRTTPRAGAMFAVNMLVGTERGGTFTEGEYTAWLREAGFGEVRQDRHARAQRPPGGAAGVDGGDAPRRARAAWSPGYTGIRPRSASGRCGPGSAMRARAASICPKTPQARTPRTRPSSR